MPNYPLLHLTVLSAASICTGVGILLDDVAGGLLLFGIVSLLLVGSTVALTPAPQGGEDDS